VATPTEAQKEAIYFFCGWPQKYVQVNTALENAIQRIAVSDAQWARLANPIASTPSGLLAQLASLYDVQIPAAYRRLKAMKVGSIELSGPGELQMLQRQGRRLVAALCTTLGVLRDADVFDQGRGSVTGAASMSGIQPTGGGSDNWVGK